VYEAAGSRKITMMVMCNKNEWKGGVQYFYILVFLQPNFALCVTARKQFPLL